MCSPGSQGALHADPSIDAVLTSNAQIAARAVGAVQEAHSNAAIGAMAVNTELIDAIDVGGYRRFGALSRVMSRRLLRVVVAGLDDLHVLAYNAVDEAVFLGDSP